MFTLYKLLGHPQYYDTHRNMVMGQNPSKMAPVATPWVRHWVTGKDKAFAGNQRIRKCYVEARLQVLISQLWRIHWPFCRTSDPQVKYLWIREEQVNDQCRLIEVKHKWLRSAPDEFQMTAECLASARQWRAAKLTVSFTDIIQFYNNPVGNFVTRCGPLKCSARFLMLSLQLCSDLEK